jgi:hypothetical protein
VLAVFGLAASLVAILSAAPAANAALHPGQYTLKKLTLDDSSGVAGSYLSCPKKQEIVTGGAFWHQSGQGPDPSNAIVADIGSSAATFDATGWYADAETAFALQLTITAQCLPKSQVGTYTLKKKTLKASANSTAGSYVRCPKNDRIVTGGAFWHQHGKGPDVNNAANDYISSSSATFDAKGWYADGWTNAARELTITALCLPKSQVGTYTLRKLTLSASAFSDAGSYLTCPKKQRIVAGGAFWHQPGKGPDPSNAAHYWIGSSAATFDAKGWYADGGTGIGSQLTITALCLPA